MSELRDLTKVFRAIQKSLKDIGEHVASLDGSAAQIRKSLHDLKDNLASRETFTDLQEEKLSRIDDWMGEFSKGQVEIRADLDAVKTSLSEHRREIGKRIRHLEPPEEVTDHGRG